MWERQHVCQIEPKGKAQLWSLNEQPTRGAYGKPRTTIPATAIAEMLNLHTRLGSG